MTRRRIHREIADAQKEEMGAITLHPSEEDIFVWNGTITGPDGSCYEGGIFNVDLRLAADYPWVKWPVEYVCWTCEIGRFSAPKVVFKTRIYHMNISERGNICIDILKDNWSPALSLYKVMLSLSSLLTDPNPRKFYLLHFCTEIEYNLYLK